MNILKLPIDALTHIISLLTLDDVSIIPTLCRYTKSITRQIYRSVKYATICSEITTKTIVDNCPNIKHLIVTSDVTLEPIHFNMLSSLNLEAFTYGGYNDEYDEDDDVPQNRIVKIPFKNVKKLMLYRLKGYNISECKLLEDLTLNIIDERIDIHNFPNLKSVKTISGFKDNDIYEDSTGYIQLDLPVTELITKKELDEDIVSLPLSTLNLCTDEYSSYDCLNLLRKTSVKHLSITGGIENSSQIFNEMKLHSLSVTQGYINEMLNISTLRYLCVANATVDFYMFTKLVNLDSLSIHTCGYPQDNFKHISSLSIKTLQLKGTVFDIDTISNLKLKYLRLDECIISPTDIAKLPTTLEELILDELDCEEINNLPHMPKLHRLHVSNYNRKASQRRFKQYITDSCLEMISRLPITNLALTNCGLCDHHMDYIANMNVNELDLEDNNLTIIGMRKLKKLPLRNLIINNIPPLHFALL